MTAPELKPCPFCGGASENWRAHEGRTAWISCMGRCAVLVSKEYKTDAEAIAAWNTRTPTLVDALAVPEVAALVDALDCLLDAVTKTNEYGDRTLTITGGISSLRWLLETEEDASTALAAVRGKA